MSWVEIKKALNSTLGTNKFKPLDKVLERNLAIETDERLYEYYYEQFATYEDIWGDEDGKLLIVPRVERILDEEYKNEFHYTRIIIPNGVTEIGKDAFSYCTAVKKSITIPNTVISIGEGAFTACNFKEIRIGRGLKSVGNRAFLACNYLTDVYYVGTEDEWAQINIGLGNEKLTAATIHYNSYLL